MGGQHRGVVWICWGRFEEFGTATGQGSRVGDTGQKRCETLRLALVTGRLRQGVEWRCVRLIADGAPRMQRAMRKRSDEGKLG